MPQKNTVPPALHDTLQRWDVLAHDKDPIVRAAARELVADLKQAARPRRTREDQTPAYWRQVIAEVINTEPHYSVTEAGFKTGHGYAHGSKSGTCVSVDTQLGLWYCSSCKQGGDTLRWMMDTEDFTRGQAWQALVDRFGVGRA